MALGRLFVVAAVLGHAASGLRPFSPTGSTDRIQSILSDREDDASGSQHFRAKRDAETSSSSSGAGGAADVKLSDLATAFHLNDSHLHLMVHWAGEGSDVIFCLARDQEMKPGATSKVFRSTNYGETFVDISSTLKLNSEDGEKTAVISKFYHHPESNCHYVFTDTLHKHIFTSTDCGATFTAHDLEFVPELVEFDKAHDKLFLVHDLEDTEKKLYVTKNFGETFSHVQAYVKSFYLHHEGLDTTLYVQRLEPDNSTTILSSNNFFERQIDTHLLFRGAMEFEYREGFLFVTKKGGEDEEDNDHIDLLISAGGERFVHADFGMEDLPNLDYHIVDVTPEGQVMVVVNHGTSLSNLYTSAKITPYVVEFSLSLERVMYYNPERTWRDSWLSNTAGDVSFVDVYKVDGLRGIYVASQIANGSMAKEAVQPDDLVSLITFDQGGMWSRIQGPETDEEGFKFPQCGANPASCSLHLSQQLSKRFPTTRSIPILSSKSAPGIVMATGNMGSRLHHRSDVFISADAGLSWHQVLKGSHYFNIGDHGGIMVAVKYFKTEGRTNELMYSINEGVDWKTVKFYKEPLKIYGLLTEPGENTTVFTLFGSAHSPSGYGTHYYRVGIDWIIIKVNLTSVFDHDCTQDDYKRWSPADNSTGKHRNCILGRKEVYERRTIRSNCRNGLRYVRKISVENCECARSDYICDFGFRKDAAWTESCVKNPDFGHDPYAVPSDCKPGRFYNRTRGYVKIRGDTCAGGRAKVYEPERVLCPVKEEKEFLLVSQRQSIVRINLGDPEDVEVLPLTNVNNVITLEFDVEDNCVMYGDIELDKIFIQCLNGSEPRVLVEANLNSVEGMAYDWIAKTLYFVDGTRRTVDMVRVDMNYGGRMRKNVLGEKALTKPRGLAVHPAYGYLFYSDWNDKRPHIGRANMDGTELKTFFQKPLVQWPNGITVDHIANRVYWVDAHKDFIASCDIYGRDFKKVLGGIPELVHPFAVAVHKELVYWDDWNKKAIFFADKNSGKGLQTLRGNMTGAMDLKIFSSVQRSGNNSCSGSPCSHICVPMPPPANFRCLCPDGMKSSPESGDENRCVCPDGVSEPSANGTCPQQGGTCTGEQFTCASNGLCVPKLWKCDGDDDCGDNSDEAECARESCRHYQFQCDNRKCVPEYWKCDFDDDCGDGSDERGCELASCTKDQFKCSNGQCISSKWRCDREKDCQDGSDEVSCGPENPQCKAGEFQCPGNGGVGQCLPDTWKCDGDFDCPDKSDEADCDGQSCKDWQFQCDDGHCIFETWHCDGERDCSDGSDEDEARCANRTGLPATPSSGEPRDPAPPTPVFPKGECNEWMFKCSNEQCIPFWWKCDGTPDCSDGSDEQECPADGGGGGESEGDNEAGGTTPSSTTGERACSFNKFRCSNGDCIWQAWVCDADPDCPDGEDESAAICEGVTNCHHDQFRCERSGECIDYGLVCDGKTDCPDETDEAGCDGDDGSHCEPHQYSCDNGACHDDSTVCDGHPDCLDMSDEIDCGLDGGGRAGSGDTVRVAGIMADRDKTNATSVLVHWWIPDIAKTGELRYSPAYAVDVGGTGGVWWYPEAGNWVESTDFSYLFKGLTPFTTYKFAINVREASGRVHNSTETTRATTDAAPPGRPTDVSVGLVEGNFSVSWLPPSDPNGLLLHYVVTLLPDGREWTVPAGNTTFVADGMFLPGKEYSFMVAAVNNEFRGAPSDPSKALEYTSNIVTERVTGLREVSVTDDSVEIAFESSPELTYRISYKSRNPFAFYDDIQHGGGEGGKVKIDGLSPSETYTVSVAVVSGAASGRPSRLEVTTTGRKLPQPVITDAQLGTLGTTVKLSWKLADDEKRTEGWVYGIYYGTNAKRLLENAKARAKTSTTNQTTHSLEGLGSCESYSFVVCIIGPNGTGPASKVYTKSTKFAPGDAPKNLRATIDEREMSMLIQFEPSCPDMDASADQIEYLITITDRTTDMASHHQPQFGKKDASGGYSLKIEKGIHHGTTYEVVVQTTVNGATPTAPVVVRSPEIPSPRGLTSHFSPDGSEQRIYWAKPKDLPKDIAEADVSYRLSVYDSPELKEPVLTEEVKEPSYRVDPSKVSPGRVYYVAVETVDKNLYSSPRSNAVAIEVPVPEDDVVVPKSSVAGILVPMFIVMILLGAGFGFYVYRHRRLKRNFMAFASRYSPASGAQILNVDDDADDSPIIRGFSDDEPLVVT